MKIKFSGVEPIKGRPEDAGADLFSQIETVIHPGETKLIPTGTRIHLPKTAVGFVCSRSGLALKNSVHVLNAPGIVDSGYTGDVGVILYNAHPQNRIRIVKGDRIAQLVIQRVPRFSFKRLKGKVKKSERGDQGFGSSGK